MRDPGNPYRFGRGGVHACVPHAYLIDQQRRLVYSRTWGRVTLSDLLRLRRALTTDHAFDPAFDVVFEVRDADLTGLSPADIQQLARTSSFTPGARRALVAPESSHFGLARMFQTHRELAGGNGPLAVCRSLHEALDWLGVAEFHPGALQLVD